LNICIFGVLIDCTPSCSKPSSLLLGSPTIHVLFFWSSLWNMFDTSTRNDPQFHRRLALGVIHLSPIVASIMLFLKPSRYGKLHHSPNAAGLVLSDMPSGVRSYFNFRIGFGSYSVTPVLPRLRLGQPIKLCWPGFTGITCIAPSFISCCTCPSTSFQLES
jgi:hypothetical protein